MNAENLALEQAAHEITQTHQALVRGRHLVDELHQSVRSASMYLEETEFDAAKAQLAEPERRERFIEAAHDGLGHVAARCRSAKEVCADLVDTVTEASKHLQQANRLAGAHPEGSRYLTPQLDALRDLLAVTDPVARAAFNHLSNAHDTAAKALEHGTEHGFGPGIEQATIGAELRQQVMAVGREVVRADEDVRLADLAVDRAHGAASRTSDLAWEVTDTARARLANEQHTSVAGPGPSGPGPVGR